MISRTVLAVVLLVVATVEAQGDVTFWRDRVKLTCPESGTWFDGNGQKKHDNEKTLEFTFSSTKEHYRCEYKENAGADANSQTYYFYIHGKACTNCFELDALVFALAIVADVIVTGIVMITVYKCTKKKTAEPQHAAKAGHRRQEEIPLSSPYAPLSHHTRSNDTYSHINPSINRTG